jgi:hypothetical protein
VDRGDGYACLLKESFDNALAWWYFARKSLPFWLHTNVAHLCLLHIFSVRILTQRPYTAYRLAASTNAAHDLLAAFLIFLAQSLYFRAVCLRKESVKHDNIVITTISIMMIRTPNYQDSTKEEGQVMVTLTDADDGGTRFQFATTP